MKRVKYPTIQDIININKELIEKNRITKAERHKIIRSESVIQTIIKKAKRKRGSIENKAAILLIELNNAHCFASANKRTAALTAAYFIKINKKKGVRGMKKRIKKSVDLMKRIRVGKFKEEEVVEWLKD